MQKTKLKVMQKHCIDCHKHFLIRNSCSAENSALKVSSYLIFLHLNKILNTSKGRNKTHITNFLINLMIMQKLCKSRRSDDCTIELQWRGYAISFLETRGKIMTLFTMKSTENPRAVYW